MEFGLKMWALGRVVMVWVGLSGMVGLGVAQTDGSQAGRPTVVSAAPPKVQVGTDKKVPVLGRRISLADFEGMQPKEELRAQLTEIADFVQSSPIDGNAATQKTVAWVGRTASTLYVVFACYDRSPGLIRSHMARRENILTDDTVSVLVDPFQDRRRGTLFQVNPMGVQADAAYSESAGTDYSYDQVWDSEGRVTAQGWMALIAIPFKSLRFRPGGEDWGVVLTRNLPRNSETDNWPHISTNVTGTLPQEGTLRGIEGVTGSHNIQINPYVLGQNEKTLLDLDPLHPYFSSRSFEGTAGGEVKAVVRDAIVFDVTVNPDFSDIESDQPQFTVDQRYPVYFPELRPFFLENANYFATPITLLYTRTIVRPEFGARVTGKVGKTNVGLLLTDDRRPGETVAPGDPEYGKKSLVAVGRVTQDIGKGSSVGVMYTDEEFGEGWNRIGGVDYTARITEHWSSTGQIVESSTKQSRADSAAVVFPAGYQAGPAADFQLTRNGHALNLQDEYQDISAGFVTTTGFLQSSNIRSDHLHANYQWYPKKSVVQSFGLETNQNVALDHQGRRVYHYSQFDPFWLLPRNTVVAPIIGQNSDSVGPQEGYALAGTKNFTENLIGGVVRSAPFTQLSVNLQAFEGGNVNYNPVAGAVPSLMHQQTVQALVTVKPVRSLTADETYLLDRDHAVKDGQLVYESQTLRTKLNYQFTRAFSARVIVEYDSTLANPLETSLPRTKQVSTEALLTWLPHPGTAIYVGYNNDLQNLGRGLCNRLAGGGCDPGSPGLPRSSNYLNDGRQVFVKASYLLRF
jgi:hypothetical protein